MADGNQINKPNEAADESETDLASFSSSDEDLQDHIMLSDRKLLLREFERKRHWFLKELVTRFNPYKCVVYDHIGMKLEFGRIEVGSAIGVPFFGHKIPEAIDNELNLQLKREFGLIGARGEEIKLPLTEMLKRLSEFTTASDEFKKWVRRMKTCCRLIYVHLHVQTCRCTLTSRI